MSDEIATDGELSDALAKAQAEFPTFEVNKLGFNFEYLSLSGILKIVLPILGKHGVSVVQKPSVKIVGERPCISVLTILQKGNDSTENVLEFPMMEPTKKTDSELNMMGSTISYLRRYALQSLLGIAGADKDVEEIQSENLEQIKGQ